MSRLISLLWETKIAGVTLSLFYKRMKTQIKRLLDSHGIVQYTVQLRQFQLMLLSP